VNDSSAHDVITKKKLFVLENGGRGLIYLCGIDWMVKSVLNDVRGIDDAPFVSVALFFTKFRL